MSSSPTKIAVKSDRKTYGKLGENTNTKTRSVENARKRRKRRPRHAAELEEIQLLYAIGSNPNLYPNAKVGWRPEQPLYGAVLDRWVMGKMGCGEQQLKEYVRQLIAWQHDE